VVLALAEYWERNSSCVQMMFAPRLARRAASASVFARFAAGSRPQACLKEAS